MLPIRPRLFLTLPRVFSRAMSSHSPVLPKLREDLKTAMRSKDQPRLTVLRGLLADITNASKTDKPISNDSALYILLRKKIMAAEGAVEEFQKAKREDLVEKETAQLNVMRRYIDGIDVVGGEKLRKIVETVAAQFDGPGSKGLQGKVMGKALQALGDRPVDKEQLSKTISEILETKK